MNYRTLTNEELIRVAENGEQPPALWEEILKRFTEKVHPDLSREYEFTAVVGVRYDHNRGQ